MSHSPRLRSEWARLYGPPETPGASDVCRAWVLEVAATAGWQPVADLCRVLQAELDLPVPGLAVSGGDGLQVWFSLRDAVPRAHARAFAQALCARAMAAVPVSKLRLRGLDAGTPCPVVPAQVADERWSAFVAPDLMPLFVDTPWLDTEPGDDAQARLLGALQPAGPAAFDLACQALGVTEDAARVAAPAGPEASAAAGAADPSAPTWRDPRDFLRAVMNDASAPLALRVEAAKALLGDAQADGGAPRR